MNLNSIKQIALALMALCFAPWASADTYSYDNLNRLKTVVFTSGGSEDYIYDAAGNLLSMQTTAPTSSNRTLAVSLAGTGTGTVTGSGINCGVSCSVSLATGSSVTLTANPAAGSSFGGWSGYAGCASVNPCTFTMPAAAVNLSATFTATTLTYALTTSASPAAGGTVSGAGSYASGTARSVTATANPGYTFTAWSGYAGCASANPCAFTMPAAAVGLSAMFTATPLTYALTTSASPAAGGTVSGAGSYASGTARSVTATANPGYTFTAWSGYAGCASVNPCTFTMPAAAVSLTATFTATPATYAITLSASPVAGGTVSGAGSYASGSARTVTATANSGYTFTAWSGYAGCASVNPCAFTMPAAAVNLVATFTASTTLAGQVAYYCFDDPANLGKDCSANGNPGA